jgi:hypothetical protein
MKKFILTIAVAVASIGGLASSAQALGPISPVHSGSARPGFHSNLRIVYNHRLWLTPDGKITVVYLPLGFQAAQ